MTQEEKAKRYDEVFNAAKEWYNNPNSSSIGKSYLYAVFPELKESEDERIRKGIIRNLKYLMVRAEGFVKDELKERIAWLEKQGEQKSVIEGTFVNVDEVREGFMQEVYRALYDDPTNDRANQIIDAFDHLPTIIIQNTADNVEQKFHEGEWVIFNENHNSVYQVERIDNYRYYLRHYLGGTLSVHFDNELIRKWTIQDAKAGDVLYSPKGAGVEGIFLIKGWKQVECTGKTLCSNIGYRVEENEIVVSEPGAIWWEGVVDPFYPATKEQRDTLMKAMADAGYTFDFEKKELKKIEDEIEIPFGAKDSELIEESYYIPKGFHAEIDGDKVVIKKGEKPTEWSEVDKNRFINLISLVKCSKENNATKAGFIEFINKLKSLRPKSTWKPSDEQMDALVYHLKHTNENSRLYKDTKKLYDQLKKLK